jgi:ketosteroid isomerase-like protein
VPTISPPGGPEETLLAFAGAIARKDVTAAAACVSRDACLVTPDATAVCGREAIRPILAQLVAMRLAVRAEMGQLLIAGDIALGRGRWRSRSAEPGHAPYEQDWRSTVVLKRVEREWKLHIAIPWESEQENRRKG